MALPTSGVLSLLDLQNEFGGVNPISMSEYYAGGANVPSGTSGTNGAVPTSGVLAVSDFYGTSNVVVAIPNISILRPNPLFPELQFLRDGTYTKIGGTTSYGDYVTPKSATVGDDYDIRLTVISGIVTGTATGSWVNLSTTRAWTLAGGAYSTFTGTMEIRDVGAVSILDSATIYLEQESP